MEIMRGSISKVTYKLPVANTTVQATWERGAQTGTLAVSIVNGVATVTLPYQQYDGPIVVNWSLTIPNQGQFTEQTYHEVVTPLLSDDEIFNILEDADEDYTLDDVRKLERSVRYIIQAHTGQDFGRRKGSTRITLRAGTTVPLPARLLKANLINGQAASSTFFRIVGGGWYLDAGSYWGPPPIRADIDGYNVATVGMHIEAPIHSPYSVGSNQVIEIEGEWGWPAVPGPVQEAAKLLINDYATDSIYRDRYLTSMTAADWRIQFNSGAFRQTGNVRADQLLNEYVLKRGWAAI